MYRKVGARYSECGWQSAVTPSAAPSKNRLAAVPNFFGGRIHHFSGLAVLSLFHGIV